MIITPGMRKELEIRLKRLVRRISSESIQKRLGFPKNSKLLIIHADDVGLCESENLASIEAMKVGMVNSGSIMVPCGGFKQIAEYSKMHPDIDLGIHLTLTSEWESYKWGPVMKPDSVPSLIDDDGMFFDSAAKLREMFAKDDIRKELQAQIEMALQSGIDLTHIDTHMFTAFSHKDIQKIYVELGEKYNLPVLHTFEKSKGYKFIGSNVIVDHLLYAEPDSNVSELSDYYSGVLKSLKPGLNTILVHTAFNNKEMKTIAGQMINYGAEWRQSDFDFFTGNECRQLIKNENIHLVTWREIRDKLFR